MEKGRSNPELTQRDGSVVEDAANKSQSVLSLEEKQNIIGQAVGQAVAQVRELISKSGFIESATKLQEQLINSNKIAAKAASVLTHANKGSTKAGKQTKRSRIPVAINRHPSMSTVTIYENATKDSTKRISTSSEDAESSDEMVEIF